MGVEDFNFLRRALFEARCFCIWIFYILQWSFYYLSLPCNGLNLYTEYAGFSLARIAQACQTNEFYLKRNFKYVFGTTVFDYIRQLKMERSKVLIKEQYLNINEISEMIGYKHPKHFSTAFKRYFGFAPSRLRE